MQPSIAPTFVVPKPRLGVDGLADSAEDAQRGEVVLLGKVVAVAHERANGRGRWAWYDGGVVV